MPEFTKKKVLFVITKSNWGGAQRYVYDLAASLPRDRFEPIVALGGTGSANAPAGTLDNKLREAGIKTIFVQSFMRDLSLWREFFAFGELYRLIRRECPDIVHLNSSKAGGLGALAARLARVGNVVFTAHGWPFEAKRNLFWRLFAWLGSWATALLSHAVIVITRQDLARGKRLPFCAHKMHLIHNGIPDMTFGSGDVIRRAFPPGMKITGTIGELTRNKNQVALLEQAKRDPTLYVAIVGEGEDRPMLERKIREYGLEQRVKLFGFISASEVLKDFDVFALPSLKEGLPYVLLEAKAAGLPIVAERVGGVGDILDAKDLNEFSLERMVAHTVALYR